MGDAETAYAQALMFDLLPTAEQRQRAGDRLAELVRDSGYQIRTGFVGTPLMCDALSGAGHFRTAYRLLKQKDCPSWLYPVTMGATTIWERWDSMMPDGSINPGEMTSFNHYALGAVADWMHRAVGGLAPSEPGYRYLTIAPRPGGGLSHCQTRLQPPYGLAECEWKIANGTIDLSVTIPPNTQALVTIPGSDLDPIKVGSGRWHWSSAYNDPDKRGPYTVDDLVGEIMFDSTSRETVLTVLKQAGAPGFMTAVLLNERGTPLRPVLQRLRNPEKAIQMMNEALANIKIE
jgi:alpha-L-rhamnosidase